MPGLASQALAGQRPGSPQGGGARVGSSLARYFAGSNIGPHGLPAAFHGPLSTLGWSCVVQMPRGPLEQQRRSHSRGALPFHTHPAPCGPCCSCPHPCCLPCPPLPRAPPPPPSFCPALPACRRRLHQRRPGVAAHRAHPRGAHRPQAGVRGAGGAVPVQPGGGGQSHQHPQQGGVRGGGGLPAGGAARRQEL